MDLYQEITDRIIAQLEQGTIPWQKPWVANSLAVSRATGKPYSLLNQMILNRPGEYVTFKQCQQEGGKIRKGEKSQLIIFWKWLPIVDEETQEEKMVAFLRYYNVFHIDQCQGLQPRYTTLPERPANPNQVAEDIISAYCTTSGVTIVQGESDQAFYRPSNDTVYLPNRQQFFDTPQYYGTAFHELAHSTGHSSRLDRLQKTAFFGSEAYSKEELIAEIASTALLSATHLETPDSFRNNAAYIQSWLRVLKNDKRFVISAATKAEKAVALILGETV